MQDIQLVARSDIPLPQLAATSFGTVPNALDEDFISSLTGPIRFNPINERVVRSFIFSSPWAAIHLEKPKEIILQTRSAILDAPINDGKGI